MVVVGGGGGVNGRRVFTAKGWAVGDETEQHAHDALQQQFGYWVFEEHQT